MATNRLERSSNLPEPNSPNLASTDLHRFFEPAGGPHVCEMGKDKTVRLDHSWGEYFKGCQEWPTGDGTRASLDEIDAKCNDAQQYVRQTIRLYETLMSYIACR